ncbi:MAG: hypothetical protein IPM95_14725 [Sphingobacteriales bacterium]|nr:hypothetical protein [Sphingobacteriales bacterium]
MKEKGKWRSAERKERLLKRSYGDDYIPKEERTKKEARFPEEQVLSGSPDQFSDWMKASLRN